MPEASPGVRGTRTLPQDGNEITTAETTWVQDETVAGAWIHNETPGGSISGTTGADGNADFTLASAPTSDARIFLYKNGILQIVGTGNDFTRSGTTLTFASGAIPITGDKLRCTYRK